MTTDSNSLREALKSYFGFDSFKGPQEKIIASLLEGKDVFVLMPTGGGKSLCYQLPALVSEGTAIVVSPLIALMKNQVDILNNYRESDGVAHFLNSTLSKSAVTKVREDVVSGRTKLLYVAPETLSKGENLDFLKNVKISFYAIDEAHCISEWGHDFRPEYRRLRPLMARIERRPVIALTATATPKVQYDIQRNLGMKKVAVFKSSFNRPNLYYEVVPKTRDTDKDMIRFIKNHPGKSGIIYCLSRRTVEQVAELLTINGIRALPYHAGMDAAQRAQNQDAFLLEKTDVIVATIAFGMGIDKPDVRYVLHYNCPKSLESYYQETGRAGRDGGEGFCRLYYTYKDIVKLDKMMQTKSGPELEIARQLLAEMQAYAESALCRRKMLMHYFGEKYEPDDCGMCDSCRAGRPRVEASYELQGLLGLVRDSGEKYRLDYIIQLLVGRLTDEVRFNGDDNLPLFGCCADSDVKFLKSLVRQAAIAGFLHQDMDNYGLLRLTPEGHQFLTSPVPFYAVEDIDFSTSDYVDNSSVPTLGTVDENLFRILSGLRSDLARRKQLPAYVIMPEQSLDAMSTFYPTTLKEFAALPGVGEGKARRFGEEFVKVIRAYVNENEIDRPEDFRFHTVATGNNLKISIIQGIDRRISLDQIAESKRIDMDELISEIEGIVEAGHKINIDYCLDETMEPDVQQEVLDFLRETPDDDIEKVFDEFCPDYTEEELRLLRVKFISDNGN